MIVDLELKVALLGRRQCLATKSPLKLMKNPEACNFIKKESLAQVFSCEFCKISKNTFFAEHLSTTASRSMEIMG